MKVWEVPDKGGSILRFLWASEVHHWEVGSTPDGPLNPGQAFLLSFLGEGAPGLGDSYWTAYLGITGPTWTGEVEAGQG